MARLVYACRFEVSATEGLDPAAGEYRAWILKHYRERHGLSRFKFDPLTTSVVEGLPEGHGLSSTVYSTDKGDATRIRWSYPDINDRGLRWSNEVRIGRFGERCNVEHQISIESIDYSIAPARVVFGSPRVVRDLCTNSTAYIGDMEVQATPYTLDAQGRGQFVDLLRSEKRRLPIVFLAPYAGGEPNLIDATQLAKNLAAVAVVVQTHDPEVTWDFAEVVGRQLSCFNGAARIYWPGFSDTDEPRNHRLFLGTKIEQVGRVNASRTIERSVFAVAAFRFVPDQRISERVREIEAVERHKRLEAQKASSGEDWESYALELDEDLLNARQTIAALEAENENLKANQKVLFSGDFSSEESDTAPEDEPASVESVSAALSEAMKKPNLEFLRSAISSAEKSPFQRPREIYDALLDLNNSVDAWRMQRDEKQSGGDVLQHLRASGWAKRLSMHISDTTKGKFRTHYEFKYEGEKRLFEPHITIGSGDPNSCASIHFIFDQTREKIIVAYVGKHLPNTKT